MALLLTLLVLSQPAADDVVPDWPQTAEDAALLELVDGLLAHPLLVGRTSADDLALVPGVDRRTAEVLVLARTRGAVESMRVTQVLAGVAAPSRAMLRPDPDSAGPDWHADARLRWRADSLGSGLDRSPAFGRASARLGRWDGCVLFERDAGEAGLADWIGGGIGFRSGGAHALAGDLTAAFGQGLVLSAPHSGSGLRFNSDRPNAVAFALPRYALENRGFRGAAFELRAGGWSGAACAGCAARDAELNMDGTVKRLLSSGVHDDSAAIAGRSRVRELAAAVALGRSWSGIWFGLCASGQRYSRRFSPVDTAASFSGWQLGQAAASTELQRGPHRVAAELAWSTGGGAAAAVDVASRAGAVSASARVRGYDGSYLAPCGRWPSLTDRQSRVDASGHVGVGLFGLDLALRGNTYRDFRNDSLPAGVTFEAGYGVGEFDIRVDVGRRYRLAGEQSRTGALRFRTDFGRERVEVRMCDEYSETRGGRGFAFGVAGETRRGPVRCGVSAARFAVSGAGVRLGMPEPGPGHVSASYSTSTSAWRAALSLGVSVKQAFRVGVSTALEVKEAARVSVGAQVEAGAGS